MLSEFDKLVKQRAELQQWWALRSTPTRTSSIHTLRVDMCKPSLVAYCGQAYAGAQNYHDAPAWFAERIRKELESRAVEIATAAYEKAIASINEQIEQHRAAVEQALAASN